MKYSVTRQEQIPFLNPDNTIMQMVNFAINISVEGDNKEEVEREADKLFESERNKLLLIIPALQTQRKRIDFILNKLKSLLPDKYNTILNEVKLIK